MISSKFLLNIWKIILCQQLVSGMPSEAYGTAEFMNKMLSKKLCLNYCTRVPDQKTLGLIILFGVGVFCVYSTTTLHICSFICFFDVDVVSIFFLSYMG